MSKCIVVGLTGGIASGKSTVSKQLAELGAKIVDADRIAREIVRPGKPAWKEIVEWLGTGILTENNDIDRTKLANIIFSDAMARERLNQITHPCIIQEIRNVVDGERMAADKGDIVPNTQRVNVLVIDAPLLFETQLDEICDEVWVVYVDHQTQLKRLRERDKLSIAEAEARIASQMSLEEKAGRADVVINNSGSINDTRKQVFDEWQRLLRSFV